MGFEVKGNESVVQYKFNKDDAVQSFDMNCSILTKIFEAEKPNINLVKSRIDVFKKDNQMVEDKFGKSHAFSIHFSNLTQKAIGDTQSRIDDRLA